MKIIYKDGGVLECSTIEIYGTDLYVDEVYTISVDEIESIEE